MKVWKCVNCKVCSTYTQVLWITFRAQKPSDQESSLYFTRFSGILRKKYEEKRSYLTSLINMEQDPVPGKWIKLSLDKRLIHDYIPYP